MTEDIPEEFIHKIGLYISDDLKIAGFYDAEKRITKLIFPGRDFIRTCIKLLYDLRDDMGDEEFFKFVYGEDDEQDTTS
jgi:hypothetical protein